jgi:hypothetical protein
MTPLMSPSELAADVLVRAYLHGRELPKIMHGAVVWVTETRLTSGQLPVLDATLCADIDSQAFTPFLPASDTSFAPAPLPLAEGA